MKQRPRSALSSTMGMISINIYLILAIVLCSSSFVAAADNCTIPVCSAGTFLTSDNNTCIDCPSNFYCSGGATPKVACPPGTQFTGTKASSSSDCTACPNGSVNPVYGAACIICPQGSSCNTTTITACPSGSFSSAGASTCNQCEAGTFLNSDNNTCIDCPSNYYCSGGFVSKVGCPPGTQYTGTKASSSSACTACPDGSVNPVHGATCILCPEGSSCTASSITTCPSGSFSSAGASTCTQCGAGTFLDSDSNTCMDCPSNYYCEGGAASKVACPPGTQFVGTKADNASDCVTCTNGTVNTVSGAACILCPGGSGCTASTITPCAAGSYSGTGTAACIPCPKGSSCAAAASSPTTCATGLISAQGAAACTTCPAGHYCLNPSQDPVPCAAGTFSAGGTVITCTVCGDGTFISTSGASACSPCPAGSSCLVKDSTPVACAQGSYSLEGEMTCTVCPAGKACNLTTTNSAVSCSPGSYALAGSTVCTQCPAGSACPSTALSPAACAAGTTAVAGSTSCSPCPAGSRCPIPNALPTPCAAGTYSPGGAITACLPCGNGTYQSSTGQSRCLSCPAGSSCIDPAAAPLSCSTGYYSPLDESRCSLCPMGTTTQGNGGAQSCTTCPAGHYCPSQLTAPLLCPTGQVSSNSDRTSCVACPAGTMASADRTVCQNCPAGSSCLNPADPSGAGNCSAGSYLPSASSPCTTCPAGSACPLGAAAPIACPTGYWSLAGAANCSLCPAGWTCSRSGGPGQACTPGSYALAGAATCTTCPPGSACPTTTAAPMVCGAGNIAPSAGSTACSTCPAGFYCPATNQIAVTCPAGYFCPAGVTTPTACLAGFACNTSSATAVPCSPGSYALATSPQCTTCPPGWHCPSTTTAPSACAPGTYATAGQTACTLCPAGMACPSTTSATVLPCSNGTYATGSATACSPCPGGKACPSTTTAAQIACAPGTYSTGQQTACTPCPAGKQCPSIQGNNIVDCAPGSWSVGSQAACTLCAAGSACPFTSGVGIVNCSAGTYSTGGATSCTACPAGKSCPSTSSNQQVTCTAGTFSTGSQATCTVCPAGNMCPNIGQNSIIPCSPGTYSIGGQSSCTLCEVGRQCSNPALQSQACPVGYYAERTGLTNCTVCPPGHKCANPAVAPVPCPVGEWAAAGLTVCSPCTSGYVCGGGAVEAAPPAHICAVGGYCHPPTQWTPCPAGTFNPSLGGANHSACLQCPPGYYCPMGTSSYSGNACPTGHYCLAGTGAHNQYPCAAGTQNVLIGRSSPTDCTACPEGRYCPAGTPSGNLPVNGLTCPAGHYCPTGTSTSSQWPCPPGTYSGPVTGLTDPSSCLTCPPGRYCVQGTSTPTPCPAGKFRREEGATNAAACTDCTSGMACPTAGLTAPSTICVAGYYCPTGTVYPTDSPCAPGTLSNQTNLILASQCEECPERYSCGWGTGGTVNPPLPCAPGHYCPRRTGYQTEYPCLPGTWSAATNLYAAWQCEPCPAGNYCVGGKPSVDGPCAPGHYCPVNTSSATQYPCPAGTYTGANNLYDVLQCTDCPPGHNCPSPAVAPTPCLAGSYTTLTNRVNQAACSTCPGGSYCPEPGGVVNPPDCGVGKMSDDGAKVCLDCTAGHYCNNATTSLTDMTNNKRCFAGSYCPASMTVAPTLEQFPCPRAYYCPEAIPAPLSCPAGTYNPSTGRGALSDCLDAPAGFYTIPASYNVTGECAPGYYCPTRSTGPQQQPCPPGTYRTEPKGQSTQSCAACVAGNYCPSATAVPVDCPQGYYCPTSTVNPEACPKGTFGNITGLRMQQDCTFCPPGEYCDTLGLLAPRGLCDPGYYCLEKAYSSAPTGPPTGGLCPPGGYCVKGSSYPTACPPGTFNNYSGGRSDLDCSACTPGFYCAGSSNPFPTGPCDAGYYCPANSSKATEVLAPPGTYTPSGSPNPVPCPVGTYNTQYGQSSCAQCTARYYCPELGSTTLIGCPAGSYCPTGSSTPLLCPAGTFSSTPQLGNVSECTVCLPGKYCLTNGLQAVSGDCNAGYYCTLSSPVPNPVEQSYGDRCTAGHYCVAGTSNPEPCPVGTYSPAQSNEALSSCLPCPVNQYCGTTGLSSPTGSCTPGYYCTGGAASASPPNLGVGGAPCPQGKFCPGNSAPQSCLPGTFANVTGLSACWSCSPGYYCLAEQINPLLCPNGSYCPEGTGTVQPLCPRGTYSPTQGLQNASQCLSCPGGQYCAGEGRIAPSGNCSAGYFCLSGAYTAAGQGGPAPTCLPAAGGVCPTGHYCPSGTATPHMCPPGTFNPSPGATSLSQCVACEGGKACLSHGLSSPTGPCANGYYCVSGSNTFTPTDGVMGNICPSGTSCGAGSASPHICDPGSYSPLPGQASCLICPAGYFCLAAAVNYSSNACPPGYYCPNGTVSAHQYPCPPGTYRSLPLGINAASCLSCPGGQYCAGQAQTAVSGNCAGGYYCTTRVSSPTPAAGGSDGVGGPCEAGTFCPSPSVAPSNCTAGRYCAADRLAATSGPCAASYYCSGNAQVPQPTDGVTGNICPAGHYCPEGSGAPIACAAGTFSGAAGNHHVGQCLNCTGGSYCATAGLTQVSGPCLSGYYCQGGDTVPTAKVCPAGYACPTGSQEPLACRPGSWQPATTQAACLGCPPGKYCPAPTNSVALSCPIGFFCPANSTTGTQHPCPSGTYSNATGLVAVTDCAWCPAGQYCATAGLTAPTGLCSAGYTCLGGSNTSTPRLNSGVGCGGGNMGDICPEGKYCVAGSASPQSCPPGTSSNATGVQSAGECALCAPGKYCTAAVVPGSWSGVCDAGYFCLSGASSPNPTDGVTGNKCPAGHFCPLGAATPTACAPGSYQPNEGRSSCESCPAGATCKSANLTWYEACPIGHYCEAGNAIPTPCPAGTYSAAIRLSSSAECTLCAPGRYCASSGLITAAGSGPCAAGHLCVTGATAPAPGGVANPNGLCPPGRYCLSGTLAPTACPAGTTRAASGGASLSDCARCATGSYCGVSGLVETSGLCAAGFYCSYEQNSTTPRPTSSPCPLGHYCLNGTGLPQACAPTQYQDAIGQSSCKDCVAGFYCPGGENVTLPLICPAGAYCPAKVQTFTPCPLGYFSTSTQLTAAAQCSSCPLGKYCVNGAIAGDCDAGYFCNGAAGSANPSNMKCPAGNYCPAGVTAPILCPNGTVNPTTGGESQSNCVTCPAGYLCAPGNPVPEECPEGHFCPVGNHLEKCPLYTYNPNTASTGQSACVPCPAGYLCNSTGLASYQQYPCPVGHYCPQASPPVDCGEGTFQNETGAGSSSECKPCPGGFYCPEGAILPLASPAGYYAPPGQAAPIVCEMGHYCPAQSAAMKPCPEGYFCPNQTITPILCAWGSYCPAGSSYSTPCPAGTYSNEANTPAIRPSVAFCYSCPPGTYSNDKAGASVCEECTAGYVCEGATTSATPTSKETQKGYQCPLGSYCPAGSSVATPCPAGTASGTELGLTARSSCFDCPANTYQTEAGQVACVSCGVSATSTPGSTTCTCIGANRAYQYSDGACVCEPRYEYYDSTLQQSDQDSIFSCQPIVYERCGLPNQGRNSTGQCVDTTSSSACSDACPGGSGFYAGGSVKICQCNNVEHQDAVCGVNCRASAPQVLVFGTNITSYDPVNKTYTYLQDISDTNGALEKCTVPEGCPVTMITMQESSGFVGVMTGPSTYFTSVFTGAASGTAGSVSRRRLLSDESGVRGINNPITCLHLGDAMNWDLSNAASGHYPVYVKNSLFNTNPNFDYGPFRDLATLVTSNQLNIAQFAYSFTEAGSYVFSDASSAALQMIVNVKEKGVSCADGLDGNIFPMTTENLISTGVSANNANIVLAPNWFLVALLVVFFLVLAVGVILFLYQFRKRSWGSHAAFKPRYRRLGQAHDFDLYASKGSTVQKRMKWHKDAERLKLKEQKDKAAAAAAAGNPSKEGDPAVFFDADDYANEFWDYERQIDLEGFSVKTLYDKLEDQSLHIAKQLALQQEEARKLYDTMRKDTTQALNDALASGAVGAGMIGGEKQKGGSGKGNMVDALAEAEVINAEKLKLAEEKAKKAIFLLNNARETVMQAAEKRKEHVVQAKLLLDGIDRAFQGVQSGLKAKKLPMVETNLQGLNELIGKVNVLVQAEKDRRCVLPDGWGGELAEADSSKRVKDPISGFSRVSPDAKMRNAQGKMVAVPVDSGIHPETGRVVPYRSLLNLDPVSGEVIHATGRKVRRTGEDILPLLINSSGKKAFVGTKTLTGPLKAVGKLVDPTSGRVVPVIAATSEPVSEHRIPVGGVFTHYLTGRPSPIRLGSISEPLHEGEAPFVIAGVLIDPVDGKVVPVGGDVKDVQGKQKTLIPGVRMMEAGSGKQFVVDMTSKVEGKVVGLAGGPWTHGDVTELDTLQLIASAAQSVLDLSQRALEELEAPLSGAGAAQDENRGSSVAHDIGIMLSKRLVPERKLWDEIRLRNRQRDMNLLGILEEEHRAASALVAGNGKNAVMVDPSSGMVVPVLGTAIDSRSGEEIMLGGTTLDQDGNLQPIVLGNLAKDPVSGQWKPITGCRLDPQSGTVVPTFNPTGFDAPPPAGASSAIDAERAKWNAHERRIDNTLRDNRNAEANLIQSILANLQNVSKGDNSKLLEDEYRKIDAQAEVEQAEQLKLLEQKLKKADKAELDALKKKQSAEMDAAKKNKGLSEAERQKILDEHAAQLAALENAHAANAARQRLALAQKLENKKNRKKQAALERYQLGEEGLKALEDSCAAEESQATAELESDLQEQQAKALERLEQEKQKLLADPSLTESEKKRLLQEHSEQVAALHQSLEDNAAHQRLELAKKLEEKRRKKREKALLQQQQRQESGATPPGAVAEAVTLAALESEADKEAELAAIALEMEARRVDAVEALRAKQAAELAQKLRDPNLTDREKQLILEQHARDLAALEQSLGGEEARQKLLAAQKIEAKRLRKQAALLAKSQKGTSAAAAAVEKEHQSDLAAMEEQVAKTLEKEKELKVGELKRKQSSLLSSRDGKLLSEEERARILKQHQEDVAHLEGSLESEADRQRLAMAKKLEEKRRKKMSKLIAAEEGGSTSGQKAEQLEDLQDGIDKLKKAIEDSPAGGGEDSVNSAAAVKLNGASTMQMSDEAKATDAHAKLAAFLANSSKKVKELDKTWKQKIEAAEESHNPDAVVQLEQQHRDAMKAYMQKFQEELQRLQEACQVADATLDVTREDSKMLREGAKSSVTEAQERPVATVSSTPIGGAVSETGQSGVSGVSGAMSAEDLARMIASLLGVQLGEIAESAFGKQATTTSHATPTEEQPSIVKVSAVEADKFKSVEKEKLEKEMALEAEEQEAMLARQMKEDAMKARENLKRQQRDELMAANKKNLSEDEKNAILAQHAADVEGLEQSLGSEAERQRRQMLSKLEEKKRKKAAALAAKQAEAAKRLEGGAGDTSAASGGGGDGNAVPLSAAENAEAMAEAIATKAQLEAAAEDEQLKEAHLRLQKELEERHEAERLALEQELEQEQQRIDEKAKKAKEAAKRRALQEKEAAVEAEMAAAGAALSEDEKKRIMAKHASDVESLEHTLDGERDKQLAAMREKMAAKKRKKQAAQMKKQEEELKAEMEGQRIEREAAREKAVKDAERRALTLAIESRQLKDDDIPEVIEIALKKRHEDERDQLALTFKRKRLEELDARMKELSRNQSEARQAMDEMHEGSLAVAESESEREAEMNRQAIERRELEGQQTLERSKLEREVIEALQSEEAKARLELRERQLREIVNACEELAPEDILRREAAKQARKAAEELADFQNKLKSEEEEAIIRLQQNKQKYEDEQRQRLADEVAVFEKELEDERKKEEERAQRRKEEMEKRKEEILREQKQRQEKELEMLGEIAADQRKMIMDAHHMEVDALEKAIEQERLRQQAMLSAMLAERRESRRRSKLRAAETALQEELRKKEAQDAIEIEALKKKQAEIVEKMQAENERVAMVRERGVKKAVARWTSKWRKSRAMKKEQAAAVAAAAATTKEEGAADVSSSSPQQQQGQAGQAVGVVDSEALIEKLIHSPIYQKLRDIEALLLESKKKQSAAADSSSHPPPIVAAGAVVSGGEDGSEGSERSTPLIQVFRDAREALFERAGAQCTSMDVVQDVGELPALCFVSYRFGSYIMDMLSHLGKFPDVPILLVHNMPLNVSWKENAFQNSYFFDDMQRTLYVRSARAETVGEFVLTILHALAHIKAGQFESDMEANFIASFHSAARILADMLFGTKSVIPAEAVATAAGAQSTTNAKDSILAQLVHLSPEDDENNHDGVSLSERLKSYSMTSASSRLRDFVTSLEDQAMNHDAMDAYGGLDAMISDLDKKNGSTHDHQHSASESTDPYLAYLTGNVTKLSHMVDQTNAEFLETMQELISVTQTIASLENEVKEAATSQNTNVAEISVQLRNQKATAQKLQLSHSRLAKRLAKLQNSLKEATEEHEMHLRKKKEENSK
jgi:hypothetical protein